jgi:hypothetical protein
MSQFKIKPVKISIPLALGIQDILRVVSYKLAQIQTKTEDDLTYINIVSSHLNELTNEINLKEKEDDLI